jgi:hypothetical protein
MYRINAIVRIAHTDRLMKFWDAQTIRTREDQKGRTCVHAVLRDGRDLTFFGEIVSVTSNLVGPFC